MTQTSCASGKKNMDTGSHPPKSSPKEQIDCDY